MTTSLPSPHTLSRLLRTIRTLLASALTKCVEMVLGIYGWGGLMRWFYVLLYVVLVPGTEKPDEPEKINRRYRYCYFARNVSFFVRKC